ncbi:single-stranded DNA-binding protein WHY1, chloroplastic-like [Cicer arietinum]|uniref:Single-stranded DNA-binding protein WHY1, chloroplastic-like n=1 Tax=Cicer arietinum TaxID=3827 RepID=A0A1S2Z484_CICAR|nr:single-stranded DNA-binding protein WHY1, chloroplastic-like [Cicer arietinum]
MSHLHLQLQQHSPAPTSLSSSSSSSSIFSSLKLCTNNYFSPKSLSFKPLTLTQPIRCRHSDLFETRTNSSTSTPNPSVGALPPRVYVGHSIYKGKAALTITPRPPEFMPLDSGAYKISRDGYLLLQFAPSVGPRQYDWNRKQVFSFSVVEMGTVISLGSRESCEFFHDPSKGKSDEGKVRKVLKVEPFPDGSGFFFNLSVQNKIVNVDESITIPITKAELAVLSTIFKFIMPYLLGWHTFVNAINPNPEYSAVVNNANPKYGGDYEWTR